MPLRAALPPCVVCSPRFVIDQASCFVQCIYGSFRAQWYLTRKLHPFVLSLSSSSFEKPDYIHEPESAKAKWVRGAQLRYVVTKGYFVSSEIVLKELVLKSTYERFSMWFYMIQLRFVAAPTCDSNPVVPNSAAIVADCAGTTSGDSCAVSVRCQPGFQAWGTEAYCFAGSWTAKPACVRRPSGRFHDLSHLYYKVVGMGGVIKYTL